MICVLRRIWKVQPSLGVMSELTDFHPSNEYGDASRPSAQNETIKARAMIVLTTQATIRTANLHNNSYLSYPGYSLTLALSTY